MSPIDKIYQPQSMTERLRELPRPLVMTNGVFDLLHRGHVSYLHRAAQLGASLLVAINTDASVRMLGKGLGRPLNSAEDRACVLASLESVDLVTFFDSRTPVELIDVVRPDIYVKGGDYDMETLEETRLVRSWGGVSVAIPFVDGFSTSGLVERIRQPMRKAAFLDRDGVINKDKGYVHRWEDFEFIPGAIQGMQLLQEAGYALVIVTNQSGIARGYYTEEQYLSLTRALRQELTQHGVNLEGVYYCPHHPNGSIHLLSMECDCRKPSPGMILRAAKELNLSLQNSLMIGDKPSDVKAARAAGVASAYIVSSGNQELNLGNVEVDAHFDSLLACAQYLSQSKQ